MVIRFRQKVVRGTGFCLVESESTQGPGLSILLICRLLRLFTRLLSNVENKWTMPIRDWCMISQQFLIKFEDRWRI